MPSTLTDLLKNTAYMPIVMEKLPTFAPTKPTETKVVLDAINKKISFSVEEETALDNILGSMRPITTNGQSLKFVSAVDAKRSFVLGVQITFSGKNDLETDWQELTEWWGKGSNPLFNQLVKVSYADGKFNLLLATTGIGENEAMRYRNALMYRLIEGGYFPEMNDSPFISLFQYENPNELVLHTLPEVYSHWLAYFKSGMDFVHTKYRYTYKHYNKDENCNLATNYIANVIALSGAVGSKMPCVVRLRSQRGTFDSELAFIPLAHAMITDPNRKYSIAEMVEVSGLNERQIERIRYTKHLEDHGYPYSCVITGKTRKAVSQLKIHKDKLEMFKHRMDFLMCLNKNSELVQDYSFINSKFTPKIQDFINMIHTSLSFLKEYNKIEKETLKLVEKEVLTPEEEIKLENLLPMIDLDATQKKIQNANKAKKCVKLKRNSKECYTEKQKAFMDKWEARKTKLSKLEKRVVTATTNAMYEIYGNVSNFTEAFRNDNYSMRMVGIDQPQQTLVFENREFNPKQRKYDHNLQRNFECLFLNFVGMTKHEWKDELNNKAKLYRTNVLNSLSNLSGFSVEKIAKIVDTNKLPINTVNLEQIYEYRTSEM